MKRLIILSFLVIVMTWIPAMAGTVVTSESTSNFMGNTITSINKMYFGDSHLKMKVSGDDTDSEMIFDSEKKQLWIIDNLKKTKTLITQEDLEKLNRKLSDVQKKMNEQLEQMSPEQRKMMENMMNSTGMDKLSGTSAETIYEKVKSDVKVQDWITDKFVGKSGGTMKSELWTVPWKKLGLKSSDYALFKSLSDFTGTITQVSDPLFAIGSGNWVETVGYEGVPVKVKIYSKDEVISQSTITGIDSTSFDDEIFAVPDDYKIQEMSLE